MESKVASTRDRILSMALTLIREGGASSFTAAELVKRASISKGSLFHHFPSLDDLAFAAGILWRNEIRVRRQKCAEAKDWESFVRLYSSWANECWNRPEERWAYNFFEERALADEKYRRLVAEVFEDEESFLVEQGRLKKTDGANVTSKEREAAWAKAFAASLRGIGRYSPNEGDPKTSPMVMDLFVSRWL